MDSGSTISMKVLMTADTIGGVWTYALDLIRELADFRVEVGLATFGKPLNREQRRQVRSLRNLSIYESSYRLEWMKDPWRDIKDAGWWLLELEDEIAPDLIHLNHFGHGNLPWRAPRLLVAHSDVFSWFHRVRGEEPPWPAWQRYAEVVRSGLASAELVVAPSAAALEDLQHMYGPLQQVRVIPNGRDPALFQERVKEPFILSVGRIWDEAKNVRALDQIAHELEWPVLVAGSLKNPDGGEAKLSGVRALGALPAEQLAVVFGRASIYALPASYEPFGLTVLEAALSGCALVLGNIPSLRENWRNAALFVDPRDETSLREVLSFLIQNDSKRRDLATKARERARFFGGSRRMASAYWQEYLRLTGMRQAVRARNGGKAL